jgi:Zn-dependent M28 family amino/carboxypeptidase
LARIFSTANESGLIRPKYTILFLPFASEEMGDVGSINYVIQHKSQLGDVVAVINLDCIGSDNLYFTQTESGPKFDLDEVMMNAATDLGVAATLDPNPGGDEMSFKDPVYAEDMYMNWWGLTAGIADASPVNSSTYVGSRPIFYYEKWTTGSPGWIHTSYDNSTSTATLDWVEVGDLTAHIKVAALALMRIVTRHPCDFNDDGLVNMRDIGYICGKFGTTPASPDWDPNCDVTGPVPNEPDGIINMRDIGIVCGNFGKHYP